MKPSLVLKMGQQLTMTPQLQQAIRLLQLSSLDLQQEVQEDIRALADLVRQVSGGERAASPARLPQSTGTNPPDPWRSGDGDPWQQG